MREEIKDLIDEKIGEVNVDLNDFYTDSSSDISKKVEDQNQKVLNDKKRKTYLSVLKDANQNGLSIPFRDDMSLEELEELARSVEIH